MKKSSLLRCGLTIVAAAALASPAMGQPANAGATAPATRPVDPDKVVLSVGTQKMTAREFDELLSEFDPRYQEPAMKRRLAEELVQIKLLADEAERRGLDKEPEIQRRLSLIRQQVLAGALEQDVRKKLDEAAMRKYYDQHKDEFAQVKARHILIPTQDSPVPIEESKKLSDEAAMAKIQELRKKIADGEDFATVARAESADRISAMRGGDLGVFGRNYMLPEFDEVAFKLNVNELSQPVKTLYGYHLIQVQEKKTPEFDAIKADIEQRIGPEKMNELTEGLKAKTPAQLDESYFPPASPLEGLELLPRP